MIILKNGGIKIIIMNTKLKAILGLASISLLIYTTYEQNKTINSQKFEIMMWHNWCPAVIVALP